MRRTIFFSITALFMSFLPVSAASAAAPGDLLVATGSVTDTSGRAVPGASVFLYAWPSDRVLGGLSPGQAVPWTLLAKATADSAGAYSLYVAPASLAAAAVSGTNANLEVVAGGRSWFVVADTARPVPATADIANVASASAAVGASPDLCREIYQHQLNRAWATVGSAYIWRESPGVIGTFSYTQSQSSSLGVGFSLTTEYGSFSADGTNSSTSATTVGYPEATAGKFYEYQTQWRTALYLESDCGGYITSYQARANGWTSAQNLITETSAPETDSLWCATYLKGPNSSFQTSSEQNKTWTGSLGLSMQDIGFNGSAVTGYDVNAQLKYDFSNATQTNYVCGTDNYAPYAARTVVQSHT